MTKEEVNELSADASRQMFQQLQLQQIELENKHKHEDSLSYIQLNNETRAAFPFVDTLYNGWLTMPNSLNRIDTIPAVFYTATRYASAAQRRQLYAFLKIRLNRDTLLLLKK